MKKLLVTILCLVCLLCVFAACAHEHEWSSDWTTDATSHWHVCLDEDCTEVDGKTAHSGGAATCTKKAVCDVCGEEYGELAEHTPGQPQEDIVVEATCTTPGEKRTITSCAVCGETVSASESTPYTVPHTGGTATCLDKAVCDVCKQPYGEVDPANHTGALGTVYTANNDGTHTQKYDCCQAESKSSCSGGEANCVTKANCEHCSAPYGEFDPTKHPAGQATYVSNNDGTHVATCSACEIATGEAVACTYEWVKTDPAKDVGTCACGHVVEIKKQIVANRVEVLLDAHVDWHKKWIDFASTQATDEKSILQVLKEQVPALTDGTPAEYIVGGVTIANGTIGGGFDIGNDKVVTSLIDRFDLHGEQDVVIRVTIDGETHDLVFPFLFVTAKLQYRTVVTMDLLMPHDGDKYGYFIITGNMDMQPGALSADEKALRDAAMASNYAFKGTIVGDLADGAREIKNSPANGGIFVRLDGARFENITFIDQWHFGCTRTERQVLIADSIANTVFNNVTFKITNATGDYYAVPTSVTTHGWLAMTYSNIELNNCILDTTVAAVKTGGFAPLFGGDAIADINAITINNLTVNNASLVAIAYTKDSDGVISMLHLCEYLGEHDYDLEGWESDATNHWHACSGCGLVKEGTTAGHTWDVAEGTVTTEPSCEGKGVRTWTCTACGYKKTEEIEADGHVYGELVSKVDATCVATGMDAHYFCDVCDKYFDEEKVETTVEDLTIAINPTAHTKDTFVYVANNDGTHIKKNECCSAVVDEDEACSGGSATCIAKAICQHCKVAYGNLLEHSAASDAKWQSDDTNHWKVCGTVDCDAIVEKSAHAWGDGVVTTEPTEDAEGLRTYTCSCGKTKEEVIPKKDHVHAYTHVPAVAETCTTNGNIEHYTCTCGLYFTKSDEVYTQVATVVIPATDHKFDDTYESDGTNHWRICENGVCDQKEMDGDAVKMEACSGGSATCQAKAVCSVCGDEYGELAAHVYVWDKSADDKDVGTCVCGKQVEFDKLLEGVTRTYDMEADGYFGANILFNTESVTSVYSKDLVDQSKEIVYSINGVEFYRGTSSINMKANEVLVAHRELHGKQNILAVVTDIYGETHEVIIPVIITTATIQDYADWFTYIYPQTADAYGYFKLDTGFAPKFQDFTLADGGLTSYPASNYAFRGTIIGSGNALGGGSQYSRTMFANLNGATIENVVFVEYQYIGSATEGKKGFLANTIKNTTFNNVTVKLWSGSYSSAVVSDKGWLAYGEVSGNTFNNFTVWVQKNCNAIPAIFGSNFSNNTFIGTFTLKLDSGITLPTLPLVIGKSPAGDLVTLCDANKLEHTPSEENSFNDEGHWYACTVCGDQTSYALHSGTMTNNGETHDVTCACGFSSTGVAHVYVWDKSAEDKDIGTCACGAEVEFDKKVDSWTEETYTRTNSWANYTIGTAGYLGMANNLANKDYARYNLSGEFDYDLIDGTVAIPVTIGGVNVGSVQKSSGLIDIGNNEALKADRTAHGYTDAIFTVTDIYGETHEIKLRVFVLTGTITSYQDWFDYIYPHDGDKYGAYKLGNVSLSLNINDYINKTEGDTYYVEINGKPLTAYPAVNGAFKGTFIGNGAYSVGGTQQYGRSIFGALDGATIENCLFLERGITGARTDGRALLGSYMKNTTLRNVTIRIMAQSSCTATAGSAGWLVSGEVSNCTVDGLKIDLNLSIGDSVPSLFGNKISKSTFKNISIVSTATTPVSPLPTLLEVGQSGNVTITICNANGHVDADADGACDVCAEAMPHETHL